MKIKDLEFYEQVTNERAEEGRPRRSIDKDKNMHCERTEQMGVGKYLRKSCYHRIECSAANSLTTLMRKWYLNSRF